MNRETVKKLLLMVGIPTLLLASFVAGGIAMATAQAAGTAQSTCAPKCKGGYQDHSTNLTKGIVTVNTVTGNKIEGTILEPSDKKGDAVTIITTASTIYKPGRSVVAPGKTIFVVGTINRDGSITAQTLGAYDPTVGKFSGLVTKIDGSTVTVQIKDRTLTIHLTASTTFLKGQPQTKTTLPASRSDLKVGVAIQADGKLNSDGSLTAESVIIIPVEASGK